MMMKNKNYFVLLTCVCFLSLPALGSEYASLKYNEVNMRTGPGERFPIKWVYKEKTYPVEVLESYELWRQVRDKDGEIGWMHQNQLTQTRHVLIVRESPLLKKIENGRSIAILQPGVIARLDRCPEGSNYCRLTVHLNDEKYTGWFLRSNIWGIDNGEIIE